MANAIEEYRKRFGTTQTTKKPNSIEQYRAKRGIVPLARKAVGGDTKTSKGLYDIAVRNGFQRDADRVLANQSGEKTKEIFSGGFISDIFDTLSALQYGTTGILKGKGFMEGVRTRQSFTDKDALGDKGLPGVLAGIALDIAVDPLTYIAPATVVKKVPILAKAIKAGKAAAFGKNVTRAVEGADKTFETIEGGTKLGKYLAQKLSWNAQFGGDKIFQETWERGLKNTAISTENIVNMSKGVAKLTPETAKKLLTKDETGRFARVGLDELQRVLKPEEFEAVGEVYKKIDDLGKEAVELGLLTEATRKANEGTYLKAAYDEYELSKKSGLFGAGKTGIKGIFKRKELTPDKMADLGQIENPAYLLFKSAFDLSKDVENAKLFNAVSKNVATDVAQEGFTKLPSGARLGSLAGKHVPDYVARMVTDITTPNVNTTAKQLVANFKFFKVVMNPGTHARNIVSNRVLNFWKLGMNPLDPRSMKAEAIAAKEVFKGSGKWIDEAKPLGYNLDTFASAEMKSLLEKDAGVWGKGIKGWTGIKKKLGDLYQAEENHAKLAAYIYQRTTKNLSPEEAWKAAEAATFNYAQVTPFVRKLRESLFGFPFITFTVKATPSALETAYKNPARISVIQKIKQGIESQADLEETDKERENEPSWVKNGFYIKLPMKDKEGRSAYFDLTYILPFGDLVSGNFLERGQNLETGLEESRTRAIMNKSPFIQTVSAIGKNKDFYGDSIWKESDTSEKQLGDLMNYLLKTYGPPPVSDQLPGGYDDKGERVQRGVVGSLDASSENQKRNLMEELLRNAGIKIQPIDADIRETYTEWNRKKALQSLLQDNGVLDNFEINYVPKSTK